MHEYKLLEILAAGFFLALVLGYGAHRLGLSPIVGYLVAGFLIGPQSPGVFTADLHLAHELAEAGVILLMFGVGLHFDIKDLLAVKGVSLPGALIQSSASTVCGVAVALFCGLTLGAGVLLGLGLAVASTVVLLRVLTDNHVLDTVQGHVAVGWLVVEDLLTVFILVLLPTAALFINSTEALGPWAFLGALGLAVLRLGMLGVLVLVVGGRVIPWLLTKVVRTRSQELFTLAVLVGAFSIAVASAKFFEASMALGAFLGGMVIGRTKVSHQAGADVLPLRDAFAVLFFLSVGMLFEPAFLLEKPWLILLCLGIVLLVKPLAAMSAVALLGYSATTGLTAAVSLAQVGEFSFILAQQAGSLGLLPDDTVYKVLVICALVSITLNPGLFRRIPAMESALRRHPGLWRLLNARAERKRQADSSRTLAGHSHANSAPEEGAYAIVVGYGPTGRNVSGALFRQGIIPVIIDTNLDTVNTLNEKERWAVFGDSTKREVLFAAGIVRADYLVITLPSLEQAAVTATLAKELNPDLRVLTRARFLQDKAFLQQAGVDGIAYEEEGVARALADLVMEDVIRCREGACPVMETASEPQAETKG